MSLTLKFATFYIRGRFVTRWLKLVDRTVIEALMPLLGDDARISSVIGSKMPRGPAEYRIAMAEKHAQLVKILIERKGMAAGVREGRKVMYATGVNLGKDLRRELHLSDDLDDIIDAAELLYRILGIDFTVESNGKNAKLLVRRCSLSHSYGIQTCEVISAMDEGVVEGLSSRAKMKFIKRNAEGPNPCEAEIIWGG
jgi:hypothetical protein